MMYKVFSVDDHVIEHANVWSDRVPAKFKDRAPHIVERDGEQLWLFDGQMRANVGMSAVAGRPPEEWNYEPTRYDEMIPGCYNSKLRAKDFLTQGVVASVNFPSFSGFAGERYLDAERDLASACVEAYNDFMIDEWCAGGPPGLFVPTIVTKIWDPYEAAKEIYRCAKRGAKALSFAESMVSFGLPSYWTDHWDPVWRACEELDMPICMHIASGFGDVHTAPEAPSTVKIALGNIGATKTMVDFSMSPVCRKFSKLKLVFSEGGIGWIPAALERADRQFTRHAAWTKLTGVLPSEIFAQNMHFCMIYEPVALHALRHIIGVERILWELDYPHADTPWPNVQAEVREQFATVPKHEADAILLRNAERVFNWKSAELPADVARWDMA